MLKKRFVAVAILLASPAFASAQDIYWSLSPDEVVSSSTLCLSGNSTTGSAYIFSDGLYCFDALDLNFTTSDSDVIRFTGGEAFNEANGFSLAGPITVPRFDSSVLTVDSDGSSGGLFCVNVTQVGVKPSFGPLFFPGPDYVFGAPVLLARVDFEVVATGTADLEFALGPQGAIQLPDQVLNPSFGSASLTVEQPNLLGCQGDVNLSGSVDFLDIFPFIAVLSSRGFQQEADCNGDEVVNFLDIGPFIEILTNS